MMFHVDYGHDGRIESVNLGGGDFETETMWSDELLAQADDRFLSFDDVEGIITVRTVEGVARYRVIGHGDYPRTLSARLLGVERSQ